MESWKKMECRLPIPENERVSLEEQNVEAQAAPTPSADSRRLPDATCSPLVAVLTAGYRYCTAIVRKYPAAPQQATWMFVRDLLHDMKEAAQKAENVPAQPPVVAGETARIEENLSSATAGCAAAPCSALGVCSPSPEPQSDDLVNCGTLSLGKADPDGQFRVKLIKKDIRMLINILKASIGDDKESAWGKTHEEVNNYLILQNLPPLVPLS